jgi:hypothetical protein
MEELKGLLVERTSGRFYWYHRQLIETAQSMYAPSLKRQAHEIMGQYFGNLVPTDIRQAKRIAEQPRVLTGPSVWFMKAKVNESRAVEAAYHLVQNLKLLMADADIIAVNGDTTACANRTSKLHAANANRLSKIRSAARYAMNEICDIDGVCATFRCGSAFGIELVSMVAYLKESSNELLSSGGDDNNDIQRIQDFYRWLLLDASKIGNDVVSAVNGVCNSLSTQPASSFLKNHYEKMLLDSSTHTWSSITYTAANSGSLWTRMRTLGGVSDYTQQLMSLVSHSKTVYSVCMSPDGTKIVSGSDDKTVKVWDATTGQCITTLEGHAREVNSDEHLTDVKS